MLKTVVTIGSGGGGNGTVTQVQGNGTVNGITLTGNVTTSGNLVLGGTLSNVSLTSQVTGVLPVANGGTGVTLSSGANSVVLRDANNNITANAYFNGFTSVAASGSTITLTVASTPVYSVTGSGGQVIQLPNATTLSNGTIFSFNNNQSSGAITVNNNSGTLIVSVPSGAYVTIVLLSNATAAGSWDRHDQTPSNVSWSTNTLDYPGSITSATWNGGTVQVNRGGSGAATFTAGYLKANGTTAFTTVTSVPSSDITGLGTMSTQNSNNVTITGGTMNVQAVNVTSTTTANATYAIASLPLQPAGFIQVNLNGVVVKVPYYDV
jgi:hypothetical protein